jgi:hypothetical protein
MKDAHKMSLKVALIDFSDSQILTCRVLLSRARLVRQIAHKMSLKVALIDFSDSQILTCRVLLSRARLVRQIWGRRADKSDI